MHPVLIELGPLTIYGYGLMIAVGAACGLWLTSRLARLGGLDPDKTLNLLFWILISGLVGSRIAFVFLEPSFFLARPWEFFYLWKGGLVFYGGVALALPVGLWLARRWKLPLLPTMDVVAPGLALGQAFGRIGCFLAGCCYGKETQCSLGVTFSNENSLAPQGIPLHPTQLYHSLEGFLLAGLLYLVCRRKRFAGQVFFLYGMLHGAIRVIIEQYRGDWRGSFILPYITPTGLTAVIFALVSAGAYIYLRRRAAR